MKIHWEGWPTVPIDFHSLIRFRVRHSVPCLRASSTASAPHTEAAQWSVSSLPPGYLILHAGVRAIQLQIAIATQRATQKFLMWAECARHLHFP